MYSIRSVDPHAKDLLNQVAQLHLDTFGGFFLSSLHPGFLRLMYRSFAEHKESDLRIAFNEDDLPIGFIAYSWHTSAVYRYMLLRHFFGFVWYSFLSFLKNPKIFAKMFSALKMPSASKRDENYVKIFSIGVLKDYRNKGVGSSLIDDLKKRTDLNKYSYITLETDAENNDAANKFYQNNNFRLSYVFETQHGRVMNKYHFHKSYEDPDS